MQKQFHLLSIGEALVDLISETKVDDIKDARKYNIFPGGQVANLAVNMALLGKNTAIQACLGEDGLGSFVKDYLYTAGVDTGELQFTDKAPTTISLIARQTATPDFTIHRGADAYLKPSHSVLENIANYRIVHTSAFALSRDPGRETIMQVIKKAKKSGSIISLDPNFHPSIWPDQPDFMDTLESALEWVDIAKPSLDDCKRIFGQGLSLKDYASKFLKKGISTVYITLGAEGTYIAEKDKNNYFIRSNRINVADVTGAGDAFWSGMLSAHLEGLSPLEAACVGQIVAEKKLSTFGPIRQKLDWVNIVQKSREVETIED